jgi:predicted enzyme related to lactoylglutathione lyase
MESFLISIKSTNLTGNKMENNIHPTIKNGKICYLEIPATDIMFSASFYKKVFGWNIRERSDGHLAFDDTINEVSGTWVSGRSPSTEAGVLIYIMVDSVVSTVKTIVSNGGKIVQPVGADSPEITARFSDPAGNIFGIYQEPVKV